LIAVIQRNAGHEIAFFMISLQQPAALQSTGKGVEFLVPGHLARSFCVLTLTRVVN